MAKNFLDRLTNLQNEGYKITIKTSDGKTETYKPDDFSIEDIDGHLWLITLPKTATHRFLNLKTVISIEFSP
jgi:hypothetical protein